jgi:CheY-like chemotaxis protein
MIGQSISMTHYQYKAKKLNAFLEAIRVKKASGTLNIKANLPLENSSRSCIITLRKGEITYAGPILPNLYTLVCKLVNKFNPDISEVAIKYAQNKTLNPNSSRELFEVLCKLRILTWEQTESYFQEKAVIALEQILPYSGQFTFSPTIEFDLSYGEDCRGLIWSNLQSELERRREEWSSLAPTIQSMEDAPRLLQEEAGKNLAKDSHIQSKQYIDGKRSLVEIAEKSDQDPLELARLYLTWPQTNWIIFHENTTAGVATQDLPTILSVDDSPVVQTLIKRILGDRYNLFLANNATDALNILNQKEVALLLLDVTMPDMDGLEMCSTLRSIPKFRTLPIVMLTGRDSLVDRMKGQIAGTNRYLTKPFDQEKLLEVVGEFISVSGNTKQ